MRLFISLTVSFLGDTNALEYNQWKSFSCKFSMSGYTASTTFSKLWTIWPTDASSRMSQLLKFGVGKIPSPSFSSCCEKLLSVIPWRWAALYFITLIPSFILLHWFPPPPPVPQWRLHGAYIASWLVERGERPPRDFFLILAFLNSWYLPSEMSELNNSKSYKKVLKPSWI